MTSAGSEGIASAMTHTIRPVILSGGGAGTCLWPLSRDPYPKQFLPLTGECSLFQETVERAGQVAGAGSPLVVSNEDHRFLVAEQLREVGGESAGILLEPARRNTAPAIALAALEAAETDPQALLLVLPADHRVADEGAFAEAVATAAPEAVDGALVTFGVVPDGLETGFGYIRADQEAGSQEVRSVLEFVEKPDAQHAAAYLASDNYYWNSGMFLLRVDRYLAELDRHVPGIAEACRRAHAGAQRNRAQDVKAFVADLEARGRTEHVAHARPTGPGGATSLSPMPSAPR